MLNWQQRVGWCGWWGGGEGVGGMDRGGQSDQPDIGWRGAKRPSPR